VYTIVGVLPPGVHFPSREVTPGWGFLSREAEVFLPLPLPLNDPLAVTRMQLVIARLSDRSSTAGADAEIKLIASRLARQYPESNTGWSAEAQPLTDEVAGEARPTARNRGH
jgi:hypothetical protein